MTSSDGNAGFEEAIRSSWTNESIVKILGENNCWVIGHVITVAQDWLYCLLEDGNSKKINRWDPCIQPVMNDDDEFNDELLWDTTSTCTQGENPGGETPSTSFDSLAITARGTIGNTFISASIVKQDPYSSSNIANNALISMMSNTTSVSALERKQDFTAVCGYTIWVKWCHSEQLHGYYDCVGMRNNRYHFRHRKNKNAELFANPKGQWFLMYDQQCLYKSKKRNEDDPPVRNWLCVEGDLPPPGVSRVELPDDHSPMVEYNVEEDRSNDSRHVSLMSNISTTSTNTLSAHILSPTDSRTSVVYFPSCSGGKNKKRSKSKRKSMAKDASVRQLMSEFEVPVELFDFHFDGGKKVAFHLNIARHMEVTQVLKGGQAEKLGVMQGDILLKINREDVSKDWNKATTLLRTFVSRKAQFSIAFVRRKVEDFVITVKRCGMNELNGKYSFFSRDKEDNGCPYYVKSEDEFINLDEEDDDDDEKFDPLTCNNPNIHLIKRVFCNPESSESLWVIRNGMDEHFYMCVTNEYLPPQHGWEVVPESAASYPVPGLSFHAIQTRFVKKLVPDNNDMEDKTHDTLNINSRTRTNAHQHLKTLTRYRQGTFGGTAEINALIKAKQGSKSIQAIAGGKYHNTAMAAAYAPKGGRYGQWNKRTAPKNKMSDDGTFSDREDTARIEKAWQKRMAEKTQKAMGTLEEKHKEEIGLQTKKISEVTGNMVQLRDRLQESQEWYYQMYLEKSELSLVLHEKSFEMVLQKQKLKEIGKRYFAQQQRSEELQLKMKELLHSFSSRIATLQSQTNYQNNTSRKYNKKRNSKNKKVRHGPSESTVSDLTRIQLAFQSLGSQLSVTPGDMDDESKSSDEEHEGNHHTRQQSKKYDMLEDEIIKLNNKINTRDVKIEKFKMENNILLQQQKKYISTVNNYKKKSKKNDILYRKNLIKVTDFTSFIMSLQGLLQNVEQEFMQKIGKLPKATMAIDWRTEYDPRKWEINELPMAVNERNISGQSNGHSNDSQTMLISPSSALKMKKKNKQKQKRSKNKKPQTQTNLKFDNKNSASYAKKLPYSQRFSGFNLYDNESEQSADGKKKKNDESDPQHKISQSRILNL